MSNYRTRAEDPSGSSWKDLITNFDEDQGWAYRHAELVSEREGVTATAVHVERTGRHGWERIATFPVRAHRR